MNELKTGLVLTACLITVAACKQGTAGERDGAAGTPEMGDTTAKASDAARAPSAADTAKAGQPAQPAQAEGTAVAPADPGSTGGEAAPPPPQVLGPPRQKASELFPGEGDLYVVFRTSMGPIVVRLMEKEAPVAVANFAGLAEGKLPWRDPKTGEIRSDRFYDGTVFHRVLPEFMIQGGDPTGTGRGGPGYRFAHEPHAARFDEPGMLAYANAGPNTNGSQFFITEVATRHLNPPAAYTIFGKVVSGQALVPKIARAGNRQVTLERVEILRAEEAPTP